MWSAEDQRALRVAAMEWLSARTNDGRDALHYREIVEFRFRDEPFILIHQPGIWKPAAFSAALSIKTAYRKPGEERPYDDDMGIDGLPRYKWRGTDATHSDNRALRAAMHQGVPLIWFWGIAKSVYKPVFPVFLIDEEPSQHQFVVANDGLQHLPATGAAVQDVLRRYLRSETLKRLHQPVFRSMIMRAYNTRCAVCELKHSVLLDAAHIVEDRHELGIAAVRNGLALCKIHHAAYDTGILGVTPSLKVEIRADILYEVDGPLLEHGLKGLHGQPLRVVPTSRYERPDPELLEIHYSKFRSA